MTRFQQTAFLAALFLCAAQAAAAFTISFDWQGLKLCNSGRPNVVDNPRFVLGDVPAGTKYILFRMTDLDARSYNHGGGLVAYHGERTIQPGAFRYKSPCPPGGRHTYEWTATAQTRKMGGKLGVATARRPYPE